MAKVVNFFIPLNIGWVRNTANLAAVLGTCSNYEYILYPNHAIFNICYFSIFLLL